MDNRRNEPLVQNPDSEASSTTLCDLLARSGLGDHDAFAELYDRTSSRAYGVTRRVVEDPVRAETIVERAYLALWRDAGRLVTTETDALARILAIVHRMAVEHARYVYVGRPRNDVASFERETRRQVGEGSLSIADPAPTGGKVTECLTDLQCQTLTLAYFGSYTNEQIARVLDVDESAVDLIMRTGLRRVFEANQYRTTVDVREPRDP